MSDRPALRVIDCNGQLDDESVAIPSDMAELVELLVQTKAQLSAEKRKNAKLNQVSDNENEIGEVLAHWKRACRHNNPRVQIPMFGARWKVTKARLADGRTVAQLRAVIDVAADLPYEQYGLRYSDPGPGRVRRDDLSYLLRDEERIEKLLELAERDRPQQEYRRFVHGLCKQHPLIVAALAMLGGMEPQAGVLARAVVWAREQEATGC